MARKSRRKQYGSKHKTDGAKDITKRLQRDGLLEKPDKPKKRKK